jgi:hypothetical protein
VVAAIQAWGRIEAAAAARRLDAIAELERRNTDDHDPRAYWACDPWDDTAAQVASALNLRHRKASGQMHIALTLRNRLPRIGALFLDGKINAQLVSAIAWRTRLIEDEDALRQIDTAMAERATKWGALSDLKLEKPIDRWVDRYDPTAVHRTRSKTRSRDVNFGGLNDEDPCGTRAMWGRLYATDAHLLDRKLQQMANGVCDADPRTVAQRRADALGALAAGSDRLACTCSAPGCPNSAVDGRAASVVIHVVAEETAIAERPDPHLNGAETHDSESDTLRRPQPPAALLLSGGIVPTPLLAELIKDGAKIRPLPRAAEMSAEPRYQPSARLQEFVRCRDLTCRFPGCDEPAEFCDVDHTVPLSGRADASIQSEVSVPKTLPAA